MKIHCSGEYFSASHFIVFKNGYCESLHGHNFRVEATLDAPLNKAGYAVDFWIVKETLKDILRPWSECLLLPGNNKNFIIEKVGSQIEISYTQPDRTPLFWSIPAKHCVILDVANTTAELLAQTIAQRLWERLSHDAPLNWIEIRLEETQDCSAVCRIPSEELL
ncbi:MAG: 6-carboxytetrahydropterin synthase [Thermoguttaceae bacterium]|nr:6-carboxytetrahydropterin synthase [Thermoguttaceae bacterium]